MISVYNIFDCSNNIDYMKLFNAFILLSVLGLSGLMAQNTYEGVSPDSTYARRVISELSSSRYFGRAYNNKGDSLAAEYLRSEMRAIGLLPLGNDYFQHYTINGVYSIEGKGGLVLNGKMLAPFHDFRLVPYRHAHGVNPDKDDRKQMVDGVWVLGNETLHTYSPFRTDTPLTYPFCIEVLKDKMPRKIRKMQFGYDAVYHAEYSTQNVCGYIPGKVDSIVVYTAHYDHCGMMGDSLFFPGAHDNASGVAAVLDIARMAIADKPYYTMVFMLFSGEEVGLCGSKYAASNPLFDLSKVRMLCNIDLFCGGSEGLSIVNALDSSTAPLVNRIKSLNDVMNIAPKIVMRKNAPNSDHYWFSTHCPAIFVFTMGGPYGGYHVPEDVCESCGLENYENYLTLLYSLSLK